jgi:hypothetical protein
MIIFQSAIGAADFIGAFRDRATPCVILDIRIGIALGVAIFIVSHLTRPSHPDVCPYSTMACVH